MRVRAGSKREEEIEEKMVPTVINKASEHHPACESISLVFPSV